MKTRPPETINAQMLADLAGITERRIRQLAEQGTIPKPLERGAYPFTASVRGLIAHFREQANGQSAQKSADQARQTRADADRAEMAAAREAGTLMLTADAKRLWSDGFVQIRRIIETSSLTTKQKQELSERMTKITLREN